MSVEQIAKIAQACFGSSPVIVLGSGASAPHGLPGMGALKDFLLEKVFPADDEETKGWAKVVEAFNAGEHLEQALTGKALPPNLTRQIVNHTWRCINAADQTLFLGAVRSQMGFALGRLIVGQFASSQRTLDIVTTNYDRVAEYACNSVDVILKGGNPNGRPNSDVLKPFWNGDDVVGRPRDVWLVDFPPDANEIDASLYERPFRHISSAPYDPPDDMRLLKDVRSEARDDHAREKWWNPYWPRPEMRRKIFSIDRYLVTPMTAEHRVFYWLRAPILPDNNLVVVARSDDTHFGLLSSRHHEVWSTGKGNRMGAGNQRRYNGASIYESFPFPAGLTPNVEAARYADDPRAIKIAEAAKRLNELRENWLNPSELVRRQPEMVPGYPDRVVPITENSKIDLKKRTLTNLYNERPAWLALAHKALDEAVSAAYGWEPDLADDELLFRLFSLNQERVHKV